jgi:hypothetical protein
MVFVIAATFAATSGVTMLFLSIGVGVQYCKFFDKNNSKNK